MPIENLLLAALAERFGTRGMRVGTSPDPLVVFPAKHAAVGDARIWHPRIDTGSLGSVVGLDIAIGEIIYDSFENLDFDVDVHERASRMTRDVVRFLQELFADRLCF